MTNEHQALHLVGVIADRLAHPDTTPTLPTSKPWWPQLLGHGVPGIALLHIELAAAGLRPWQRAHDWLACATRTQVTTGADSHLYYGAPAIAHALACAAHAQPGAYGRALDSLDQVIASDTRRRVDAAHRRIERGELPNLAEFDVIRGLSGVGSYLLHRDPNGKAVRAVLEYLVRLTEPVKSGGELLPGWWTAAGPSGRDDTQFPDGHGNAGMAHGIAGPLAALALAALGGVTVDGHLEAIGRICAWLDQWRTDTDTGSIWPYVVKLPELRDGCLTASGSRRPGWCYGTAGLARAQQLAALATGDDDRRNMAEDALIRALADPVQLAATTDASLCHGYAGLAHIAVRTAAAATPAAATRLYALVPRLLDAVQPADADPQITGAALLANAPGFLEGAAGIALAALGPATNIVPSSHWDGCLLIA